MNINFLPGRTSTKNLIMESRMLEPSRFASKMDILEQARLGLQAVSNLAQNPMVGPRFLPSLPLPERMSINIAPPDRQQEMRSPPEDMESISSHRPLISARESPDRLPSPDSRTQDSGEDLRSPSNDHNMSMDDGADADDDDDDISVGSPPSPPVPQSSCSSISSPPPPSQSLASPIPSPASLLAPSSLSAIPSTSSHFSSSSSNPILISSSNSLTNSSNLIRSPCNDTSKTEVSSEGSSSTINRPINSAATNNLDALNALSNNNNNIRCSHDNAESISKNPNNGSQQGIPHPKVEPLDPDLIARTPPVAHQAPSPQIAPTQRQLKFSIDNILKPEFGSRRCEDSSGSETQQPVDLSREIGKADLNVSPGRPGISPRAGTPIASSDSSKLSSDTELWPAWVFCTRYSDRPSAGITMFLNA